MDRKYDEKTYNFYKDVANRVFEFANGKINTPIPGLELVFDENDTDMVTMNTLSIEVPIYSIVDYAHIESTPCEGNTVAIIDVAHLILYSMAGFDMDRGRYPMDNHVKYITTSLKKYVSEFMYDYALDLCNLAYCTTLGEYLEICYRFHEYDRKYAMPFYHLTKVDHVCELIGSTIDIFNNYNGLLKETMEKSNDIVDILKDYLENGGEALLEFRDLSINPKYLPVKIDGITAKETEITSVILFYKQMQNYAKYFNKDHKAPYVWSDMLPKNEGYCINFNTKDEEEVREELEGKDEE